MVLRESLFSKLNNEIKGKVIYGNFDGVVREVKVLCGRCYFQEERAEKIAPTKFELYLNIAGVGKKWVTYSTDKGGFISAPHPCSAELKLYLTEEDATNNKYLKVIDGASYKDVFRYLIGDEKLNEGSYAYKYSGSPSSYFRYRWNGNAPEEVKFDKAFGTFDDLSKDESYILFDYDGCRFACSQYNGKLREYFSTTYATKEECCNANKMVVIRFADDEEDEEQRKSDVEDGHTYILLKSTSWSCDDYIRTEVIAKYTNPKGAWDALRYELKCEEGEGAEINDCVFTKDGAQYSNDDGSYCFTLRVIKV